MSAPICFEDGLPVFESSEAAKAWADETLPAVDRSTRPAPDKICFCRDCVRVVALHKTWSVILGGAGRYPARFDDFEQASAYARKFGKVLDRDCYSHGLVSRRFAWSH